MSSLIKAKLKLFAAVVFLLFILLISALFLFLNAGTWLLISDNVPDHIDLVFTFAGENVRDSYSRELMEKFPNAHWLMSDYKFGYSRILRRDSFDMSRVTVVDTCENTLSEVNTLKTWIEKNKQRIMNKTDSTLNVGLVSGPYHMRRIKMMIEKNITDDKIHLYYLPVPLAKYKWTDDMYKRWWKFSSVSVAVVSELQKILYFLLIF